MVPPHACHCCLNKSCSSSRSRSRDRCENSSDRASTRFSFSACLAFTGVRVGEGFSPPPPPPSLFPCSAPLLFVAACYTCPHTCPHRLTATHAHMPPLAGEESASTLLRSVTSSAECAAGSSKRISHGEEEDAFTNPAEWARVPVTRRDGAPLQSAATKCCGFGNVDDPTYQHPLQEPHRCSR